MSVILIVSLLLTISVPAYAEGNVFNAIPSEYYASFLTGAAIQLVLGNTLAPMNGFYIAVGIAIAREVVDSTLSGGQFNWEEAGASALGSGFAYYLSL
jgi:hypothetical protein